MFCDEATIHLQSGNGGDGLITFHREKYVSKGPPDGGDGGWGGSVIFKANRNITTLQDYKYKKFYKAESGKHGERCNRTGRDGADLVLKVPEGTQVYDAEDGELLVDLLKHHEEFQTVRGGKGGLGNTHFSSSVQQAPQVAEIGEPGAEREVKLELKLVADAAIIGMPNAGKSTLISTISEARPKIADYPFTTLIPNLGVVSYKRKSFVVCDVPGLIEGAHKGKGLGHQFLRHIERTKFIIHLLDASDNNFIGHYKSINNELKAFSKFLFQKDQIVIFNKIDLFDDEWLDFLKKEFRKKHRKMKTIYAISAATGKGIPEFLNAVLHTIQAIEKKTSEQDSIPTKDTVTIHRPHLEPRMDNYAIVRKRRRVHVSGKRIEQLIVMTDFSQRDAPRRIYNIMKKVGILKGLKKYGLKEGDSFWIGEKKLEYRDTELL